MADLATITDVEDNYRSLSPAETVLAGTLLRTASGSLRVQVPDLDARMVGDVPLSDLVRGVVALAVVRVLRGKDPRDPAQYDSIFFTRAELDRLREGAGSTGVPVGSFPAACDYPAF